MIYWALQALENVARVDEVYVATDCDEIGDTVINFDFSKVRIFRRSSENAQDESSTESVMLEFIDVCEPDGDDILLLVQATSPLTRSVEYEEALAMYESKRPDSILTCVRSKRFLWDIDSGKPLNYDYRNRPRRQDFSGVFMENGAFYINTVGNIKKHKNRLSGSIMIYEMPEYTAIEIDEPDDWEMAENLMRRHVLKME